ncbi:transient receptor potential cation channel subfamily V member 1 isoform X1 [Gadus morhua]|uniref:transient receptor potential cation channel subfamily V member 1 isoform X1 n=1 Tax=Gadus morhua TaxID=8049 RepID=UPI0011B812C7|nr:transient receptor potential cation channel subfamily V member 1-like isoform X1 [Gadus morhua]
MSKTPIDEDRPEPGSDQTLGLEDESDIGFDWLLMKDRPVESPSPMDTSVVAVTIGEEFSVVDHAFSGKFTRSKVFEAASRGDPGPLSGLQDFLQLHHLKLTSPEYIDEGNGKTALLKALLNLNDGKNDTIQVLLDISEKTEDLKEFVNAAYNDKHFKGQTALHVAIERRSFDQVKLLVEKGADVQAKANGAFFQLNSKRGFYFGELPLSLAACTNQLEVVSFLMENQYRCADSRDHDSLGNTVLHALVIIADNTVENTEFIVRMYDEVLFRDTRLALKGEVSLEAIENKHGLTPLKLAAKMGKIGLFRYLVQREFTDEETKGLSRKFTDWIYGPIRSSLYDMTSIDTSEENSVLEIIVFGNAIKNRQEMLQVEPLHSLLEEKWQRFARRIFLVNFLVYVVYLGIFTTVALSRKEGQPPFPVENTPLDCFRCIGELVSVLGAVYFFIKGIVDFKRKPPRIKSMYNDGFNEISFFLQASLLLVCTVFYVFGWRAYVGPLVLSLALAWINILYYSRGSKSMGMYNVMIQRIILSDIICFLFVYMVFLYGFSAAVVTLIEEDPLDQALNRSQTLESRKPTFNNIHFTALEMFKFTIGMGNLEFTDQMEYIEVFYILLISYIMLTYILLLNMLIALMSATVERVSRESESIWRLQRSLTILDLERSLPLCLRNRLQSGMMKTLCLPTGNRTCFRVEEVNWKKWRSNLGILKEEDPELEVKSDILLTSPQQRRRIWNMSPLFSMVRGRRSGKSDPQDNVI